MGSLMAGWDCNIPDPQVVKYKRNKSLTKEEIEAFWKSRKHIEEDHEHLIRDSPQYHVLSPPPIQTQKDDEEHGQTTYRTSNSSEEKLIKKHGWWVSSSLAHLNEPPVLSPEEAATFKRVSLFKQPQTAG